MLLDNNTERVMNLALMVDDLKGIDKIRLAIHILEDLGFTPDYDITNFIKILKEEINFCHSQLEDCDDYDREY